MSEMRDWSLHSIKFSLPAWTSQDLHVFLPWSGSTWWTRRNAESKWCADSGHWTSRKSPEETNTYQNLRARTLSLFRWVNTISLLLPFAWPGMKPSFSLNKALTGNRNRFQLNPGLCSKSHNNTLISLQWCTIWLKVCGYLCITCWTFQCFSLLL